MRGDILGVEQRRRWSYEDTPRIVMTVGVDGAAVTQVAQRHDLTRQQIYRWCHGIKPTGGGVGLLRTQGRPAETALLGWSGLLSLLQGA